MPVTKFFCFIAEEKDYIQIAEKYVIFARTQQDAADKLSQYFRSRGISLDVANRKAHNEFNYSEPSHVLAEPYALKFFMKNVLPYQT